MTTQNHAGPPSRKRRDPWPHQRTPRSVTALPGPNAQRVLAGDQKMISPSYTRSYPMVAKSGRGIVVTDVDGNEFFDFLRRHRRHFYRTLPSPVVAAIQKQAAELIHMSGTDFYYEHMVQLAERLSKIAPMPGPTKSTTETPAPRPSSAP